MSLKGVKAVEQHVEKIVLGVVAVLFLSVLSIQFLGGPNTIQVGNQDVAPADAFKPAERMARVVIAKVEQADLPPDAIPEPLHLAERFKDRLKAPVVPSRVMASALGRPLDIQGGSEATVRVGEERRYVEPTAPAPTGIIAALTQSTIDPYEAIAVPGLADLLPDEQPFDKVSISVEGAFDGTALKAMLQRDPDGPGGLSPIPTTWWRGVISILAVQAQREEWVEQEQAWTNATIIDPAPGQVDLLGEVREQFDQGGPGRIDLVSLANEAGNSDMRAQILRPEYYRTIAGPEWVRPERASSAAENQLRKGEIDRLLDTLAKVIVDRKDAEGQVGRAPPGGPGREPGNRSREGGEGERNPSGQTQAGQSEMQRRQRLDRLMRREDALRRQLLEQYQMEVDENGRPIDEAAGERFETRGMEMTEEPEIRIWAHDLTVEPGKTYRYRLRVVLNNPAYRQPQLLEEQKQMGAEAYLYSQWSQWTDPISASRDRYFFVVSASERGQLGGMPRASVRMYEFYYGYWRGAEAGLAPGQAVWGQTDLPDGLFVYDLESAEQAPPPGRGRQSGPGGRERQEYPLTRQGTAASTPVPEGAQPVPNPLPIQIDAVLLDVVRVPAQDSGRPGRPDDKPVALFRDEGGRIVVRDPQEQTSTRLYRQIRESARLGLTQGQPAPEPERKPTPTRPTRPERESNPDEGGGGGGGG